MLQAVAPDFVHAGPVPTSAFVAATAGVHPLAAMSWGSDLLVDADRDRATRERARFALGRSDLLFCDCDAVREKARTLAGFAADRIVQFPWGVDLDRFRPDGERLPWRERPGWQEATLLVSTRSWEPGYGIESLLESFARATARRVDLRLVLVGSGSLREWVERFVAEHGLRDKVLMPGAVDHDLLPPYFRSADVYVAATPADGSSVSLLEALASGLPAVVADNPGNREWVTPGTNGWLARPGDPDAFARRLAEAAALPAPARRAMAAANRALAEARADWSKNKRLLLAAYDRVEASLSGSRPKPA